MLAVLVLILFIFKGLYDRHQGNFKTNFNACVDTKVSIGNVGHSNSGGAGIIGLVVCLFIAQLIVFFSCAIYWFFFTTLVGSIVLLSLTILIFTLLIKYGFEYISTSEVFAPWYLEIQLSDSWKTHVKSLIEKNSNLDGNSIDIINSYLRIPHLNEYDEIIARNIVNMDITSIYTRSNHTFEKKLYRKILS